MDGAKALLHLLAEWFPLGKELKDLEEIVGSKTRTDKDGATYKFSTGVTGGMFKFRIENGVIEAVTVVGM